MLNSLLNSTIRGLPLGKCTTNLCHPFSSVRLPFASALTPLLRNMSALSHAQTHDVQPHEGHTHEPVTVKEPKEKTCTVCSTSGCNAGTKVVKPTTPVTFYMRELPSLCIPFSSKEGKDLFKQAMTAGTMEGFFKLMEQFRTQEEPSYCGLASLAMVLNALAIDPRRPWKGPWRWFTEELLDCCAPLEKVRAEGIVFQKVACLGRCNGAEVDAFNFGTFSEEDFRSAVLEVVTHPAAPQHLLVSYSRKALGQTGDGHFSPIGGYHKERDLVLVLDVAAFKYPPHWVPLSAIYHAMSYIDPATSKPRGYMLVRNRPLLESVMFTLGLRASGWGVGHAFLTQGALQAAAQHAPRGTLPADASPYVSTQAADAARARGPNQPLPWKDASPLLQAAAAEFVRSLVCSLPLTGLEFVVSREGSTVPFDEGGPCCIPYAQRHHVLFELRGMPLFNLVQKALGLPVTPPPHMASPEDRPQEGENEAGQFENNPLLAERMTILLLLLPQSVWNTPPEGPLRDVIADLVDLTRGSRSLLRAEISYLQHQLSQIEALNTSASKMPTDSVEGSGAKAEGAA